jgi:hypothetical protein
MNRGRVGEERGSKETDRCPLTAITIQEALIKATHKIAKMAPQKKQNHGGTLKYYTHSRLPATGKLKLSKKYTTLTQFQTKPM